MISFEDSLILIRSFISAAGVAVIALSAIRAIYYFLLTLLTKSKFDINRIRLELGYGIILGLEFIVGADIIQSIVKPNYYDIGLLAIVVFIRTFLSYFMSKELQSLRS